MSPLLVPSLSRGCPRDSQAESGVMSPYPNPGSDFLPINTESHVLRNPSLLLLNPYKSERSLMDWSQREPG